MTCDSVLYSFEVVSRASRPPSVLLNTDYKPLLEPVYRQKTHGAAETRLLALVEQY